MTPLHIPPANTPEVISHAVWPHLFGLSLRGRLRRQVLRAELRGKFTEPSMAFHGLSLSGVVQRDDTAHPRSISHYRVANVSKMMCNLPLRNLSADSIRESRK